MRFNVFFLKKRYIYYSVIFLLILILSILFILSKDVSYIFSTSNDEKVLHNYDLTGDGTKDSIHINKNNNTYQINVESKNKNYILDSKNGLKTLGSYYSYWPLRITLLDASRDNLPEIFVQASKDNAPIENVFMWKNNKFENILSSSNNLLGFIDYHNNKTPKIILGNLNDDSIDFANYIISKNSLIKYAPNYDSNFLGKDSILQFVKYVKTLPYDRLYTPNEIFRSENFNNITNAIDKLCDNNSNYNFQDGMFIDDKCDKEGNIKELKWILNFKATSIIDKNTIKNCTIKLILKPAADANSKYYFKIYSCELLDENSVWINEPHQ
ncbi:hypothetical protein SAMN02745134_02289 [Clostridium acidisoli DSM 12555]|uniref:Repeat domain-containing protein n=1 Tax=Clostridium acidisoli DSM 12555 TaxID=1121291 RepID=A0A1W1XLN1_9CLOT|nr:hypothetical protein SAMN02745134_02289 [Clostridium acidisoli DSM 12555]